MTLSYEDLLEEVAFLRHEVKNLSEDKNYLEEQIRHLKRLRYAASSEIAPSGQRTLFNEAEFTAEDESEEEPRPQNRRAKKRGRPVRKPLPSHLPEIQKNIDLSADEKFCPKSGLALKNIGSEVSKQIDIKPMTAVVIVTTRQKYACDCSECKSGTESPTMRTAPVEPSAIPKGIAAPGLLAFIAVSKYEDAMPLARQEKSFQRFGIDLDRSTMASWIIKIGKLVTPLINLTREELIRSKVIQADETRIQVHRGTGKKATADNYMWVFLGERPDRKKIVLYELGPSRSHLVPLRILEGYRGYLHTDGYEAYETLSGKMEGLTLVGDWAHARRKFDEAVKAAPKGFKGEIKAQRGLDLINEIFRIERENIAHDASEETIIEIRRDRSKAILGELRTWADATIIEIPPKTLTGAALRYLLERWEKLILFVDVPILRMDTNPVEGLIRPFAVGRRNWLFAETVKGADASAALYSLLVMARAAGLNTFDYLHAVFTDLPKAQSLEEIEALLPWIWKPASADA